MMTIAMLAAFFLTVYATGPAGKDDLAARKTRLDFPRALALKGAS